MAGTLLLTRSDIISLVSQTECIEAVERAFRMHGEGNVPPPTLSGLHSMDGSFHVKSAAMNLGRSYFVSKVNANFPGNRLKDSLPTIQGIILLCDGEDGTRLAMADSVEITIMRTAAATAVAAKFLSLPDSTTAGIIGCGNQGRASLRMLRQVRPIESAFVFDVDRAAAEIFADRMGEECALHVEVVDQPSYAVQKSDICVTCTPSKRPYLKREWLRPGIFVAAVGADDEEKQELEPEIIASSTVVTDITSQCAAIGELHHALAAGLASPAYPYAELGEIVAGKKCGRSDRSEICIFDSTGMALQDLVVTVAAYEKATKTNIGMRVDLLH